MTSQWAIKMADIVIIVKAETKQFLLNSTLQNRRHGLANRNGKSIFMPLSKAKLGLDSLSGVRTRHFETVFESSFRNGVRTLIEKWCSNPHFGMVFEPLFKIGVRMHDF